MKYMQLIAQSKENLASSPQKIKGVISINIFDLGAKWMFNKLHENNTYNNIQFNQSTNFLVYGLLKYAISVFVFLFSIVIFYNVNFILLPLSIITFYLAEIHFLFLFPLLIDNVKNPIWISIKLTYKMGILNTLMTVIPIGIYMLLGLLNFKDPFRNWYVGCLAILIWYQNEIRNRI